VFSSFGLVMCATLFYQIIPELSLSNFHGVWGKIAIREAIVNSYCHRLYTSSQNNEITIYSNRVEIYNPGTFPEGLTPKDFIEGSERSVKRNPLLAQLMYFSKDIESFGTGLKRITEACNEAGVEVDFQLLKKGFAVVFYRPDDNFNTTEKQSDVIENVIGHVIENKTDQAVFLAIIEHSAITADQIAGIVSRSVRTVQRCLDRLQRQGLIRRVGPPKGGRWEPITKESQ